MSKTIAIILLLSLGVAALIGAVYAYGVLILGVASPWFIKIFYIGVPIAIAVQIYRRL